MAAGEPRRLRLGVAVLQLCLRVVQLLLCGGKLLLTCTNLRL